MAPFSRAQMLGWLVDSGSPSIVIAYALVFVVFEVLRRRKPDIDRPFGIDGHGNGSLVIGVFSTGLCLALVSLYLLGMPAFLRTPAWTIFGLWWVLGAVFLFRIPTGVHPGPDAEQPLVAEVGRRRGGPGGEPATPAA